MKTNLLILGTILLIIGMAGYGATSNEVQQCKSIQGQAAQYLDPDTRQECDNARILQYGSIGIVAAGLIISTASIMQGAAFRSQSAHAEP